MKVHGNAALGPAGRLALVEARGAVPTTTTTISSDQRDGLYELIAVEQPFGVGRRPH
jgi:hypothetical protein